MNVASLILFPLSPMELGLILLILLVLFGASRLGDLGKGLGEGIRNFKKTMSDDDAPAGQANDEKSSEPAKP